MYGFEDLKPNRKIGTECPVKGCSFHTRQKMDRNIQDKLEGYLDRGKSQEATQCFNDYFCKVHEIFISPTVFIYKEYQDNLLWNTEEDAILFNKIQGVKRIRAQLHHDTSEDAVSWNVFRFMEKNNLISSFLTQLCNCPVKNPEVIYWSYSQSDGGDWTRLMKARNEFEARRGTEPDIIVKSDTALFFIEAKLNAPNVPTPSNLKVEDKYVNGGQRWWDDVFCSDFKTVAVKERKYQLLRLWLLGTWIANRLKIDFYLINLLREGYEEDIETQFKKHIKHGNGRKFRRITWEDIYYFISKNSSKDKDIVVKYFKNKTLGYKRNKLQKAFFRRDALQT